VVGTKKVFILKLDFLPWVRNYFRRLVFKGGKRFLQDLKEFGKLLGLFRNP